MTTKTSVYFITNINNGHAYVGVTKHSLQKRLNGHLSLARKRHKSNRPIICAIRKHGAESFCIWLLETFETRIEALEAEKRWIIRTREFGFKLYNATDGGEDGSLTPETKTRISKATREGMKDPKVRQKIIDGNLGKKRGPMSDDHKEKIRQANKGHVMSEEQKEKLRIATSGEKNPNWGRKRSDETKKKSSDSIKRAWASLTPEEREARCTKTRDAMSNPDVRKRISDRTKEALEKKKND